MLLSSLCVCSGQLLWKLSASSNLLLLLLGFALYAGGALIMLYAYRFGKLSVLQPILSANYVFTILLANLVLKEKIFLTDIVGVIIIILGVILIGGADND